ncbi:DUF1553 domain-containing protein [Zavarzinella formosa]|uniref:DUF1553 domain-containing protein n=1 Tax=Zavarzinella formosa TaxID=360055 RepID=UPI00030FE913|nr:DUF1553 domain-containing protein [Zavarzinella formosa]
MLIRLGSVVALLLAASLQAAPPDQADRKVDYNRDVRPILSDHCFKCHGPDEKQRKAKLRLDTREAIPGAKTELLARVTSNDPKELMPPANSGKALTPGQINILKRWIDQGAPWSSHWAFTPPVRPEAPKSRDAKRGEWAKNPIDAFILDRLEQEGLSPSPEADKPTLIRRVTLDLTGLPPTPEEVDAFLKDNNREAYAKVVDRLLASPRYGERMAWRWLEAARYSDTNGYQTDAGRDMWRWRDWVIEAYNRNLPFDQFTIEQLAGDMLPKPTLDQRIATGFNRNHRGNSEGGIVPQEYAVEYVADRVETTATVWLGLTFTCCRCHDHKFDPVSQREFYKLFAFFNNVPEQGRAVKFGNSPPYIKAPTISQQKRLAELNEKLLTAEKQVEELRGETAKALALWEPSADDRKLPDTAYARGLTSHWPLDGSDVLKAVSDVHYAPGRIGKAMDLDGVNYLLSDKAGDFGFDDRFSLSCWVSPRKPNGTILSRTTEEPRGDGYAVALVDGKLQVHLTKRWLDDALRIETITPIPLNRWSHITVTYDATRLASGTKVYLDGEEVKIRVLLDQLNQTFQSKEPFRIGGGNGTRFDGLIDDVKIHSRELDAAEVWQAAVPATIDDIRRKPDAGRTEAERQKLLAFFVEATSNKTIRTAHASLRESREQRAKFWETIPTVMVMEEMPTPRESHILLRGEYDKKGEKVTPGVPAALVPAGEAQAASKVANRLDFARWLASPKNPLMARVAVNRAWQSHFGVGLVKTTEDFGTQGAFPTHPELLDWLAVEFATDWDVKQLHKLIVMSATYQQSSHITKELLARDPENKLLARFPRLRLSAEVLRDQALFASGLLAEKIGGPSVKPYQPAGLWKELSGADDYIPDTGENLYRRSLYTYWKRTSPPPVLAAFDAAGRETCWVRESRTNTPLQALALLNETAFVESARSLAQRVMREAASPDERLTRAFRHVTARPPTTKELQVLRGNFEFQLAGYRANPPGVAKLLAVGEAKADPKLNPAELAAYSSVCNLLLNLDEVVTKE